MTTSALWQLPTRHIVGTETLDGKRWISVTAISYTQQGFERRDVRLLSPNAAEWLIAATIHGATLADCTTCERTVHEDAMCCECGQCEHCCDCKAVAA